MCRTAHFRERYEIGGAREHLRASRGRPPLRVPVASLIVLVRYAYGIEGKLEGVVGRSNALSVGLPELKGALDDEPGDVPRQRQPSSDGPDIAAVQVRDTAPTLAAIR